MGSGGNVQESPLRGTEGVLPYGRLSKEHIFAGKANNGRLEHTFLRQSREIRTNRAPSLAGGGSCATPCVVEFLLHNACSIAQSKRVNILVSR